MPFNMNVEGCQISVLKTLNNPNYEISLPLMVLLPPSTTKAFTSNCKNVLKVLKTF